MRSAGESFFIATSKAALSISTAAVSVPPYRTTTPYIIVNCASRAIDFYKAAFSATELVRLADPRGKVMHAEIRIGNAGSRLAHRGRKDHVAIGYRQWRGRPAGGPNCSRSHPD
jgi:hypothetical protein